jgi:hypothetical protein
MLWLRDPETCASLGVPAGYAPHAAFSLGYPASVLEPNPHDMPKVIWQP